MGSRPMPWNHPDLNGWDIVGMNHYHAEGGRSLFVAMTRAGHCVVAEGHDELGVFNALAAQARLHNQRIEAEAIPGG